MKRIVILITILAFLFGCVGKYQPEDEPQIVVEGWIEAGGYPVVILTTTVSVGEQQKDWASLKDHVIRWAKVSISDGEEEVVLTGSHLSSYGADLEGETLLTLIMASPILQMVDIWHTRHCLSYHILRGNAIPWAE